MPSPHGPVLARLRAIAKARPEPHAAVQAMRPRPSRSRSLYAASQMTRHPTSRRCLPARSRSSSTPPTPSRRSRRPAAPPTPRACGSASWPCCACCRGATARSRPPTRACGPCRSLSRCAWLRTSRRQLPGRWRTCTPAGCGSWWTSSSRCNAWCALTSENTLARLVLCLNQSGCTAALHADVRAVRAVEPRAGDLVHMHAPSHSRHGGEEGCLDIVEKPTADPLHALGQNLRGLSTWSWSAATCQLMGYHA